eukprot:4204027-Amphidinium_carterae.1
MRFIETHIAVLEGALQCGSDAMMYVHLVTIELWHMHEYDTSLRLRLGAYTPAATTPASHLGRRSDMDAPDEAPNMFDKAFSAHTCHCHERANLLGHI